MDKTPLTAQHQFSFQQEGAPLHCTGEVQNLSSSQAINWVQRNNQMATKIPGFHSHTFFLLGSSEVTCVSYLPTYNWWPARKYPHYYRHHGQNLECVCDAACGILSICVSSWKDNFNSCFSLQDWTYGTPGIWRWEANYSYRNFTATFST